MILGDFAAADAEESVSNKTKRTKETRDDMRRVERVYLIENKFTIRSNQ